MQQQYLHFEAIPLPQGETNLYWLEKHHTMLDTCEKINCKHFLLFFFNTTCISNANNYAKDILQYDFQFLHYGVYALQKLPYD